MSPCSHVSQSHGFDPSKGVARSILQRTPCFQTPPPPTANGGVSSVRLKQWTLPKNCLHTKIIQQPLVLLFPLSFPLSSVHTEPAPAICGTVKTVLSCQPFALSLETVHFCA